MVVTFETGPALNTPITTQYQASAFVSFSQADGYRPYRKAVGTARSGTTVANIGADLCPLETPDDDCELPIGYTSGRLTRTATGIRFSAGFFEPVAAPFTPADRRLPRRRHGRGDGTARRVTSAPSPPR